MELIKHIMIYNNKNQKLRILGKYFCRNNRNKGNLIINNKKFYLQEFIETKNINQKKIKIKMILNKNIFHKSYMFKDCESLLELTINDNLDNMEFHENSEMNDSNFEKSEGDSKFEEIIDDNIWNEESNGSNNDYFLTEETNNNFYENYDNYISIIPKKTEKNVEDSALIYWKFELDNNNYSNLEYSNLLDY